MRRFLADEQGQGMAEYALIIAVVYSTGVGFGWLAAAGAGMLAAILSRDVGVRSTWGFVVIGSFVWFGLHEAGIHPTIAGVVQAFRPQPRGVGGRDDVVVHVDPEGHEFHTLTAHHRS